jgi:hypothetical protein
MIEVKYEFQLRELFFKHIEKLDFRVAESRSRLPDYILEGDGEVD